MSYRGVVFSCLLTLLVTYGYGQQHTKDAIVKPAFPVSLSLKPPSFTPVLSSLGHNITADRKPMLSIVKRDFTTKCLPFFCEKERMLDKKLPIALRVRLGSLQQADWLESKPSAVRQE